LNVTAPSLILGCKPESDRRDNGEDPTDAVGFALLEVAAW
jgi:hypothetical protein